MNLPIAARELRVAAHDRASYRARVWLGAVGIFTTIWIAYGVLDFTGRISTSVGAQIFGFQAWAAYIFACCTFNATADSISREKRDGTLGLLFLTQLKGRDVVLGKLCSGMTLYFAGAFATLPILTLPVLLGGIQLSQSFFLLISILNCMLFSAAVGLFASAICVQRNQAGSLAVAIVIFQCVAIPIISWSMLRKGMDLDLCIALGVLSPFFAQQVGQGALLGFERYLFALSIGIVFLQSLLFLAATAWIAPRSWQVKQREPLIARLRRKFGSWSNQTIRSRSELGRRLLDANAYEWLAARRKSASRSFWEFVVALLALCAALIFNFIRHYDPAGVLILVSLPAAYILQLNCKMRVGGHACERICEDRDCNALELILSTPMTLNQIVAGEFRALWRHFFVPVFITVPLLFLGWFFCLGFVVRFYDLFNSGSNQVRAFTETFAITGAMAFFLVIDSIALAWMGTWISLSIRKTVNARALMMVWTLCGPFLAFALTVTVLENSPLRFIVRQATGRQVFAVLATYIIVWDVLCIGYCRRKLRERGWAIVSDPLIHTRDVPSPFAILGGLRKILKRAPFPSR